jgi:glycosyltransferase involved in cell wall biosynthesis
MSKQRLKKIFDSIWGYRLLQDAAKLIALTPMEAEQYRSFGAGIAKIETVPNGIDLAEFEKLPPKGRFRKKHGVAPDQKMVLYLARLHKIKGPDLLVRAFASIVPRLKDAQLMIVGPDEGYLPALKELVQELDIEPNIHFIGPLYGKEKLEAYVDADVYVLPSIYETFPVAALEASACGTPVILTEYCGAAGMIDGQAGLVVGYDKDQLSDAILRMLSNEEMRQKFAEKGKSLVREKFNWAKIAEQVENIYLNCLPMKQ